MKTAWYWRLVIVGFTIAAINVPTAGQSSATLAITDTLAVRTPQSAVRGPGFGVQGARLRGPRVAGRGSAGPDSGHSDPAWPRIAIADPTTLGFTKSGLEALDARMAQAVADGDTAGMTIILLRRGQVAAFRSYGQQKPDTPMPLDALFRTGAVLQEPGSGSIPSTTSPSSACFRIRWEPPGRNEFPR